MEGFPGLWGPRTVHPTFLPEPFADPSPPNGCQQQQARPGSGIWAFASADPRLGRRPHDLLPASGLTALPLSIAGRL